MPSIIRILDEQTINKIAAGEVIENPASVVKELVENALDADATEICVEIKGGGRQLIRVSDNGSGMSQDDALLCLERHATSKIRDAKDIQGLTTMGFRGEAIPSIAAISKFTLLTCPNNPGNSTTEGTLIQVDGGRILSCKPAPCSPGTTIEVNALFFNVPVRKKFQKSPSYDTQEILRMLSILALGYPTVKFELRSDQKVILNTTLANNLSFREQLSYRLETVLGRDFCISSCPIDFHEDPYHLEGFIGLPTAHRPNRTGQYLFLNQRMITSPLVSFAVREGYGTSLPTNRYPIFVLHLNMPGDLVDVNVHPQKREVRLRQELHLKECIARAVLTALQHKVVPSQEQFSFMVPTYPEFVAPAPFMACETPVNFSLPSFPAEKETAPVQATYTPSFVPPYKESTPSLFSLPERKTFPKVLTTLPGYVLFDSHNTPQEGLGVMDQKAAYTRIRYEYFLKQLAQAESEPRYVQPLLIPLTLEFPIFEAGLLKEHQEALHCMGFSIREFGDNTFVIDAVPDFVKKEDLQTCLTAIMQDLIELQDSRHGQRDKHKRLALAACRSSSISVKRLSIEEGQALLNQLLGCELSSQCPFGKRTWTILSLEELAKIFQK